MLQNPFYDPQKSFDENFDNGPYGAFADRKVHEEKYEPKYSFLGQKIYLPFGIPAGPLPNAKFLNAAFEKGFDINTYKTQRSVVFPCNAFPNVLFVNVEGDLTPEKAKIPLIGTSEPNSGPLSITNSFGNPSRGPEFWQEDMKKAVQATRKGQVMIASAVGTIKKDSTEEDYYDDFAHTAKLAAETGAKIIEVNLSCPNVADEGILCYTPHAVEQIARKSKEAIGDIPLVVKIGHYAKEQDQLLEHILILLKPFIAGVAAINTIPAAVVDEHENQALPGPNRLISGICGACIKWAGLDMTKRLANIRENIKADYVIIGVGGVVKPEDFQAFREAGADVVQSATGAMWNPFLAQEIKEKYQ